MKPKVHFPEIMGIINVTPDSFSDRGTFLNAKTAVDHALRLIDDGADYLDIGGESTRPGSSRVDADEELRRVIPAIEGIRRFNTSIPISIDTSKSIVASKAVNAGATMINDVTAGTHDAQMFATAARHNVPIVVMHMRGTPTTMQKDPQYTDVVAEVELFLRDRAQEVLDVFHREIRGVHPTVFVDPGIGFGKTIDHNVMLLNSIERFNNIAPVVVGISRKSFIGTLTGIDKAEDRDDATVLLHALLLSKPIAIARVHNVALMRQLKMLSSVI